MRVRRLATRTASLSVLLLAALAAADGAGPRAAGAGPGAPGSVARGPEAFAASPLWDDGRAEIDAYEASVRRYGVMRPLTAYLIVVKEDFSKTQLVKADPGHDPADLLPVLKLNHVINYQTGIYSYHQMASAFFDRGTMELVKLSLTSNEWCGNTYKEYTRRDGGGTLHVHTYWDGQAEATYPVPGGPDVVFYDALPLYIRRAGWGWRDWFLVAWIVPPSAFYTLVHFGQAGYVLTFLPALVILLSRVLVEVLQRGRTTLPGALTLG